MTVNHIICSYRYATLQILKASIQLSLEVESIGRTHSEAGNIITLSCNSENLRISSYGWAKAADEVSKEKSIWDSFSATAEVLIIWSRYFDKSGHDHHI